MWSSASTTATAGSRSDRDAGVANGADPLDPRFDDLAGLQAKLLPLAGVGPWTVGYVAMRVIGAPDVFLANDAAVRNGIRSLGQDPGADPLSPDFREVSPWRSYATMHLWRAAAAAQTAAQTAARTHSARAATARPKTTASKKVTQ